MIALFYVLPFSILSPSMYSSPISPLSSTHALNPNLLSLHVQQYLYGMKDRPIFSILLFYLNISLSTMVFFITQFNFGRNFGAACWPLSCS